MKIRLFLFLGLITASACNLHAQWIQKGSDINGEAANDKSGNSVCLNDDGNMVIIGASKNDGGGVNRGHARVYEWSAAGWVQKGSDLNGEDNQDAFGFSVSMSEDGLTLAVGGISNDGGATDAGHVRVFEWGGTDWVQKGIDMNGENGTDYFGCSVSLSADGNRVAIGAYGNDGNGSNAGHTRVYSWNGAAWLQLGGDIDGEVAGDFSGSSVSLSKDGNYVAIGAPYNDAVGSEMGHTRIFRWNPVTASWVQRGGDIDGEASGNTSGFSVSINEDGSVVAIGAPRNTNTFVEQGHARVYEWNGTGWVQKGTDMDGEHAGSFAGWSVSIDKSGNTIAVGSISNDGAFTNAGQVMVYEWTGSAWQPKYNEINGEAIDDQSGYVVSLNASATMVAIGAPGNNGFGTDAGHVRIYQQCPSTSFITPEVCGSYTSPSGLYTWTTSGIYSDTLTNLGGCDSIISIDLTVNNADTTVTVTELTLSSVVAGASYQWLDCATNQPVAGETGQLFSPVINGSYALILTQAGCTDTSSCYTITSLGTEGNDFETLVQLFPNPSCGPVQIELGNIYPRVTITIRNTLGQVVSSVEYTSKQTIQLDLPSGNGVYFVEMLTPEGSRRVLKTIKE